MADQLEKFIKRRGTIKAFFTRCEHYLKNVSDPLQVNVNALNAREKLLNENFNNYSKLQDAIEDLDPTQDADRIETESRYIEISATIRSFIDQLNEHKSMKSLNNLDTNSLVGNADSVGRVALSRLPKLNIPKFKGDYQSWNSFRDLYVSAIHHNSQISGVEKFQFLKTLLTGEPLNLIDSLAITNANYDCAWQLLEKRYSNISKVANCHIKAILDLKPVAKGNSSKLREFISHAQQHINALKALNLPIEHWDVILVFILSSKLDFQTRSSYEKDRKSKEFPIFKEFIEYLDDYCSSLENSVDESLYESKDSHVTRRSSTHFTQSKEKSSKPDIQCYFCSSKEHFLYNCPKFKQATHDDKHKCLKKHELCINCFRKHNYASCTHSKCKVCHGKHHTLLCKKQVQRNINSGQDSETQITLHAHASKGFEILLPTAIVRVRNSNNQWIQARALLDSASQNSFVTTELVKRLNVPVYNQKIQISSISNSSINTSKVVDLTIGSRVTQFSVEASCVVLDDITCQLPHVKVTKHVDLPHQIKNNLADSQYFLPGNIDILLGADIFFQSMLTGKLSINSIHFQNSHFGYLVSGSATPSANVSLHSVSLHTVNSDIDTIIPRFWEIEELPSSSPLTDEEKLCEISFQESVTRLDNGQFQVQLPFLRNPAVALGSSFHEALNRFYKLERRLIKDDNLYQQYKTFINEYLSLGHGNYVKFDFTKAISDPTTVDGYFCPHHPVINQHKESTKVRVVFDGSSKSTSGVSLNDILGVGPVVQPELFDVMMRFRLYKYVFTADIKQMYRRILIEESHRKFQRIIWRNSPQEPLQCIELCTVTYGLASSPYLATRTLNELAASDGENYPLAKHAILNSCYVDDFLAGKDSIEELNDLQSQLSSLLESANMHLHKWHSNCQLDNCSLTQTSSSDEEIFITALGLAWDPTADEFQVKFAQNFLSTSKCRTKRSILSTIAKCYDPLGLISPIVVKGKILMQQIWIQKIDWDDEVPDHILQSWVEFSKQLESVRQITIPRWCFTNTAITSIEIHGFCDASARAYGACIYIQAKYDHGEYSSQLLCSKSRVSPLKVLTIPRLALCSAVLLSRLVQKVIQSVGITISKVTLYTDSSIVLSWMSLAPAQLSVFVAHRVAEIQSLTSTFSWSHVGSKLNPADLISRDVTVTDIYNYSLWHGSNRYKLKQWNYLVFHSSYKSTHGRLVGTFGAFSEASFISSCSKYEFTFRAIVHVFGPN